MNFKKAALALAVSSVAAAPIVASADGEIYASARIGLQYSDNRPGESDNGQTVVRNWASRIGMRGETDLGNGWAGWGRYEFNVDTDGGANTISLRHGVVGLKNDDNNIYLGQTYHTFYNYISGPADVPWWGSGDNMIAYRSRTPRGLSYDGDFGVMSFGATAYLEPDGNGNKSEKTVDAYEAAVGFDIAGIDLALGVYDEDRDFNSDTNQTGSPKPVYGLAFGMDIGPVGLEANYQQQDKGGANVANDRSGFVVDVTYADFYVHVEALDVDNSPDPVSVTLGYTHVLGPRTLMWFELQNWDLDQSGVSDRQWARAALKYDIL